MPPLLPFVRYRIVLYAVPYSTQYRIVGRYLRTFRHPKDLEVVPHPEIIIHINSDMNINIHIDINMNIDIHIIINMDIEDYKRYSLLFIRFEG